MKRRYGRIQLISCCLLLLLMTGCRGILGTRHAEEAIDFPREISRLERNARYHPEISARVRAHLDLAFLYLDHRNSRPDYARALQEMMEFVSLDPTETMDKKVLDWLQTLKEMERLRKEVQELGKTNQAVKARAEKLQASMEKAMELNKTLRDEVSGLKQTNRNLSETNHTLSETNHTLRDGNQSLRDTNQKLVETIESLKALDAQMEEKRRQIK